MSVLAFPRLYVRGEMSWDPPVGNNFPATYSSGSGDAIFKVGEDVDAFRARMINQAAQSGNWNYFGSHRCAMEATTVVGGIFGPDDPDVTADPMITAPVRLVGKLVDIDPYGIVSQVFFDELLVGVPGGPHLRARPRRRMVARWLTFNRNRRPQDADIAIAGRAAAAWQAVFAADDVEVVRADESPLLTAVAEALEQDGTLGLMLRLSTYNTRYFTRVVGPQGVPGSQVTAATSALSARHAAGEVVPNPAYSHVVGTLGLWLAGDSECAVSGRHLLPDPPSSPAAPSTLAAPAAVEYHADSRVLSLDLSHAVPETGAELAKADLGTITVSVTRNGTTTALGTIEPAQYARAAYEARGGIVDVPVAAPGDVTDLIRDGRLELRVGGAAAVANRQPIALEQELTASADDVGIYLQNGESRQITITVRERGAAPTGAVTLTVAGYGGPGATPGVVIRDPLAVQAGAVAVPVGGAARVVEYLCLIVTKAGTAATVPPTLALSTAQLLCVRTLPADGDLANVPDEDLTWQLVYNEVLRHFHAITPRMSTIIDLSDPDAVQTFAARILAVTDLDTDTERNPPPFERAGYMPVTRDLSANRRAFLRRYCAKVQTEAEPSDPIALAPAEPVAAAMPDATGPPDTVVFARAEELESDIEGAFPKIGPG